MAPGIGVGPADCNQVTPGTELITATAITGAEALHVPKTELTDASKPVATYEKLPN